jgi:CelD/BcsL family acetyltransferase involved in cellulose biosynthesis
MIAVHEIDDEQTYEAEASQCVRMTGYHHWFFLTAMAEALHLKFRVFAVDANGERLGVVPLLFRRRGPVSTVNYLPIGCIGPLLRGETLREGRVRELVKAMEPVLWRHRTAVTQWGFSPGVNVRPEQLTMPGFELAELESFVIPGTKSPEDCLKAMSRVRRQSIRQSEGHGLVVTDGSREEITGWFPGQIGEAYRRQGAVAGYRQAEAQSLTEQLAAHPRMLWRTVKTADGDVVGMTGCVIGDDRLWGWLMAGPPMPGVSAQSLCYWDLIKWSLPQGLAYDLGAAPSAGIRSFKVSLGADIETYATAVRTRPRLVYKAAQSLYNRRLARIAARQVG